ncbi:hypothetical protein MMC13_001017 [Lambiella insularis]|nr:hypothetical protein [Lambiella insularis]
MSPLFPTIALCLAVAFTAASPMEPQLHARALSPAQCSEVITVIDVLKLYQATPFCSSFLDITTVTSTTTKTTTTTSTVTTGTASTSIIFLPGASPTPAPALLARDALPAPAASSVSIPSYISAFASTAISSACECLNLPTPSTTITKTSTTTKTITTSPPTVTKTVYPCAPPLPSPGPAYGVASNPAAITAAIQYKYPLDSPEGASAETCCNTCFFTLPNCIQAYWYFYEGCVTEQATAVTGTGPGVSAQCPNGRIAGLTYGPDLTPPFRSTGSIAGACGVEYSNI